MHLWRDLSSEFGEQFLLVERKQSDELQLVLRGSGFVHDVSLPTAIQVSNIPKESTPAHWEVVIVATTGRASS